jgi:transposase InsO family protein
MTAPRRRLIADQLRVQFGVSQRRVSRALGLARSGLGYAAVVSEGRSALARRIEALSAIHPRFGYRRIWVMLEREGWSESKNTVSRHWRQLGLRLAGKPAGIKPRRPHGQDANACRELRDEFLEREDFESEAQAQASGTLRRGEYNTERPHSSLAYQTPAEYAAQFERYVPIDETPATPTPDEHPHS